MRERLGIDFRHLKLADGNGDEEAEIALVQFSELEVVDGARRCDRRLDFL